MNRKYNFRNKQIRRHN